MSYAQKSLGATLKYTSGGTESFTSGVPGITGGSLVAIPGLLDVTGPGMSKSSTDASAHDDLVVYRVWDLVDGGTVTFDINYYPTAAAHAYMLASSNTNRLEKFVLSCNDLGTDTVWTFLGQTSSFVINQPVRGQRTASVTIEITGAVTETAGS